MGIIINTKRWHLELDLWPHIPDHLLAPGSRRHWFKIRIYNRANQKLIKEIKKFYA